jgi:hypothetical protein
VRRTFTRRFTGRGDVEGEAALIDEYLQLETDKAKYFVVVKSDLVEVTGGFNADVSLRREEKSEYAETVI